jgi:hypothetical protein
MPLYSELLLPIEGTHHIVLFPRATKGRYVVHVESHAKTEQVVAFVPISGMAKALGPRWEAVKFQAPGLVRIEPQHLPFKCFAGDNLAVVVKLPNDVGSKAPQFEARIQGTPTLRQTETGMVYTDMETVHLNLTHEADEAWHGTVTPTRPGRTYVSLRVSGETASRKPFMEEVLLTDSYTIVDPVVARLLSLAVKAVDEDGDGRFERLDVTAELDVFDPGDYALGFSITSAGRKPNLPAGRWMTLGQGRQTITVSLSGKYVWSELRDGPFLISGVWVLRSGGANSVKVPPTDIQVRTEAWKPNNGTRAECTVTTRFACAASGRHRRAGFASPKCSGKSRRRAANASGTGAWEARALFLPLSRNLPIGLVCTTPDRFRLDGPPSVSSSTPR